MSDGKVHWAPLTTIKEGLHVQDRRVGLAEGQDQLNELEQAEAMSRVM